MTEGGRHLTSRTCTCILYMHMANALVSLCHHPPPLPPSLPPSSLTPCGPGLGCGALGKTLETQWPLVTWHTISRHLTLSCVSSLSAGPQPCCWEHRPESGSWGREGGREGESKEERGECVHSGY